MDFKESFRPTKIKIWISIIFAFIYFIFFTYSSIFIGCFCPFGSHWEGYSCDNYSYGLGELLFETCFCYCTPPIFLLIIFHLVVPFNVAYIVISLKQLLIKKGKS